MNFLKKILSRKVKVRLHQIQDNLTVYNIKKPKKRIGKVAVLKLDALGDAILFLQSSDIVCEYYKSMNKEVVLFCNITQAEFYKNFSKFDKIIPIKLPIVTKEDKIDVAKIVRSDYYEKVINFHFSRCPNIDDFVVKVSCADSKIGWKGDNTNNPYKQDYSRYYSKLFDNTKSEFEGGKNFDLLNNLDITSDTVLPDLTKFVQKTQDNNYMVIGIGASNSRRMYPIEKLAKICLYIIENSTLSIKVVGSMKEQTYFDKLQSLCQSDRLVSLCGVTNLQELINVIGNAKFAISNDTGTAHIVGATKINGIVILGGGNGNRFFPHAYDNNMNSNLKVVSLNAPCKNCGWNCSKVSENENWPCVCDIDEKEVIKIVNDFLN